MQRTKFFAIILGLLLFFFAFVAFFKFGLSPYGISKSEGPNISKQEVEKNHIKNTSFTMIEVAGRSFNIPKDYLDAPINVGVKENGIIMNFSVVDFISYPSLKKDDLYDFYLKSGKLATLVVLASSDKPATEISFQSILAGCQEIKKLENTYGLTRYQCYWMRGGRPYLKDEIYSYEDSNGKIDGFIICMPNGASRIPMCSHSFVDKNLRYKLAYNKKEYLSNWRDIKTKTIRFLDSFEASD